MVTGSEGFIGRHLVRTLSRLGWRVRGVDIAVPDPPAGEGVTHHTVDIRNRASMEEVLAGVEVLFHLASAHLQHGASSDWYHSVNVEGARSIAQAAAQMGVQRLVHTSSVGVYGDVGRTPVDEDAPKHPSNVYERTKLLGEDAVSEEATGKGLEFIVLRPGWVYGPGCRRTEKLLRSVRRRRFVYVGDGSNLRHPLHISDMMDAFLLAADAPASATGRTYLVVGPRPVSVRELVRACARVQKVGEPSLRLPRFLVSSGLHGLEVAFSVLGRTPPLSRRSLAFFENDNAFTGRAAAESLGFYPRTELDEGLLATLNSQGEED